MSVENSYHEIDEGTGYVGYREAFSLVCSSVRPVGTEEIPLDRCAGRIVAEDLLALVSYPTTDVSLKDGFAVRSADVAAASAAQPVCLRVIGSVFAGSRFDGEVAPGRAVRICSGAAIPHGANAVVSGEFCEEVAPGEVNVRADAEEGRNILRAGGEVSAGARIIGEGEALLPGRLGLAAAAGISGVKVYRRPKVAVVAVGDEVVAPGGNLKSGQLYASNLVTISAWLASFEIEYTTSVVSDDVAAIRQEMLRHQAGADVILTSGGAWGSERDLVVGVLDGLGWRGVFHHVRMGPGKGVAFGLWEGRPVFCLPGGPASNEMAFLQLALPGVLRMGGDSRHPLPTLSARLDEEVKGRHPAWTEFRDVLLTRDEAGNHTASLYRNRSRLQAMAGADGLICVPEGTASLRPGEIVPVQLLRPRPG